MQMSERHGLAAINLREDDELIEVKKTDNNQDIFLVTKYGHVYPLPRDRCKSNRPSVHGRHRYESDRRR